MGSRPKQPTQTGDENTSGDEIASRIRSRRKALGLSLAKLAAAAGIRSRSYVLHIENGTKAPSEGVAGRIAEALGDDPALYRAWALARSRTDLAGALRAARTLSDFLEREKSPGIEPEPIALGGAAATARPQAAPISTGAPVRVPLIAEGADPDADVGELQALEVLELDPKVFPPGPPPTRPFGYRLSAHGVRRLPDLLQPGDCVVISRDDGPPVEDAAYAVRVGARVELTRVRTEQNTLCLPYGPPGSAGERLSPPPGLPPGRLIVGKLVVAIRRWL